MDTISVDTGKQQQHAPTRLPGTCDLSVVVPVHNEQENIVPLYERIVKCLERKQLAFTVIFVDDGSADDSGAVLEQLASHDSRIVVIELSRNFGQQAAIRAGLEYAIGAATVIMDADLQDPPELLAELIAKWKRGYEVVYAVRARREHVLKDKFYKIFYRLLRAAADTPVVLDSGDFCLLDRMVVDAIRRLPERTDFLRGIRSWVGFRHIGVPYERDSRHDGKSSYSLLRLTGLAVDGLVSCSRIPLRVASLLGITISLASGGMGVFYLVKKVTVGLNPPGFATLIVSVLFLAGVQLIVLGIIGEYIGRIFDEVRGRPHYIVRRVVRSD